MAATVPAAFTPTVLKWARESLDSALEEAAKKIGIEREKLAGAESGRGGLSVAQLRKAADAYRRPLSVFLLDRPPTDPPAVPDFRRFPKGAHEAPSWKLHLQMRKVQELRRAATELIEFGPTYQSWNLHGTASLRDDPEKIGAKIRERLEITDEKRLTWSNKYQAFNGWREAVEHLGVLVFLVSGVPLREMRGFSLPGTPYPAIALNRRDDPSPRTFTLLHEFSHLLLNKPALCNVRVGSFLARPGTTSVERKVEIFCNAVAGAALVPEAALEQHGTVANHDERIKTWQDQELGNLATSFKVSREVVLRRLVTLGRASVDGYKAWRARWKAEASESRQKDTGRGPAEKGHEKVLRTRGRSYVRLVLGAMHSEAITASEASGLLDMKLRHLAALEEAASR